MIETSFFLILEEKGWEWEFVTWEDYIGPSWRLGCGWRRRAGYGTK